MNKLEKWKKMSLVKRLRAGQGTLVSTEYNIVHPKRTMLEAADRIEALEAENARLREALSHIVDASDYYGAEFRAEDQGSETLAYAHKSTCNLARAALEEQNDD